MKFFVVALQVWELLSVLSCFLKGVFVKYLKIMFQFCKYLHENLAYLRPVEQSFKKFSEELQDESLTVLVSMMHLFKLLFTLTLYIKYQRCTGICIYMCAMLFTLTLYIKYQRCTGICIYMCAITLVPTYPQPPSSPPPVPPLLPIPPRHTLTLSPLPDSTTTTTTHDMRWKLYFPHILAVASTEWQTAV